MKKRWLKLLCPVLALCLAAGVAAAFALQAAGTKYPFRVGYSIVSIQPDSYFYDDEGVGLPLAGYGNTKLRRADYKLSEEYEYDKLKATCIALADEVDNKVLLIAMDAIRTSDSLIAAVRKRAADLYGIPAGNVFINSSHSHSAPDYTNGESISYKYTNFLVERLTDALKAAMEDLTEVDKMSYGAIEVEQTAANGQIQRMNFTRHMYAEYKDKQGKYHYAYVGDNFTPVEVTTKEWTLNKYVRHALDADPTFNMVQFTRKDGKAPVLLTNFRAHPHSQGGSDEKRISADVVGSFRHYMMQEGYLMAHFQGAAGMTNSNSYIANDMILSKFSTSAKRKARTTADANWVKGETVPFIEQYGHVMVDYMKRCLQNNMTEATPHLLSTKQTKYWGYTNKAQDDQYENAKVVQDMWNHPDNYLDRFPELEGATVTDINHTIRDFALTTYNIRSVYEANAIVSQHSAMETRALELNAILLDDILCIGTAPNELYHQNSIDFEQSAMASGKYKFAMTFGYTNGSDGYLPSERVWQYTSYETDTTSFERGTGEKVAKTFCDMVGVPYMQTPAEDWQ